MLASTLLVTIRGPFTMMDLELPGDIAVGKLLPLLLEMSDYQEKDPQALLQANAQLHVAGAHAPLPLHKTLIDAGVYNGAELEVYMQEWQRTPSSNVAPQQFGRRSVQPGIDTGGIGITWESPL